MYGHAKAKTEKLILTAPAHSGLCAPTCKTLHQARVAEKHRLQRGCGCYNRALPRHRDISQVMHNRPMSFTRRHHAITALHAVETSPGLAKLAALTRDSSQRLLAIQPLVPPLLRASLQAGPIEGSTWCLLVKSNAAAAKLRQLLPALGAHLRTKGWDVAHIRIKVQN